MCQKLIVAVLIGLSLLGAICAWRFFDKAGRVSAETGSRPSSDADIAMSVPAFSVGCTDDRRLSVCAERNEIANGVLAWDAVPDGFVTGLCRSALDPAQDEVWRDYCLQFLGTAFQRFGRERFEGDEEALQTLRNALSLKDGTFAGTALLSLRKAAAVRRELNLSVLVAKAALSIASSKNYSSQSRVTALLTLEELRHPFAASTASRIISETSGGYLHEAARAVLARYNRRRKEGSR